MRQGRDLNDRDGTDGTGMELVVIEELESEQKLRGWEGTDQASAGLMGLMGRLGGKNMGLIGPKPSADRTENGQKPSAGEG